MKKIEKEYIRNLIDAYKVFKTDDARFRNMVIANLSKLIEEK